MIYVENGGSAYFITKEQLPEYIMRGFHIPHSEKTVTKKPENISGGSETKIKQAEPKTKKRTTKTVKKGVDKDVR